MTRRRVLISAVVAVIAVVGVVLGVLVVVDPPSSAPATASSRAPSSFVQAAGRS